MELRNLPIYQRYAQQIDAAKSEADVRLVLRAASTDPAVYHSLYHELGVLARDRIADIRATAPSAAKKDGKK